MASYDKDEGNSCEESGDMATSSEMDLESPDVNDMQTSEMNTLGPDVLDRDVHVYRQDIQTEEFKSEEIRIVIVGRTGSGKSSLGNQILMKDLFQSAPSAVSVTEKTEVQSSERNGMKIVVADTPGLFHTTLSENNVKKQISKCLQMTLPGPHVFLYTMKIGRHSDEEIISFNRFLEIFGENVLNHTILVFTGKDYLLEENIRDYVDKLSEKLKKIVKTCQERIVAFNNVATHNENQQHWHALLDLINTVKEKNNYFYADNSKRKTVWDYLKLPFKTATDEAIEAYPQQNTSK